MSEKALQEENKRLRAHLVELEGTIDAQARMIKSLLDAQNGTAESKILREELRKAIETIREMEEKFRRQNDENEKMRRLLAYYESENMPTSTISFYNDARKKFRERRGENPKGGPGEKKSPAEDGTGGSEGGIACDSNGKRRGPPPGHKGVSHHNKATLAPLRYHLDAKTSPCCGVPLEAMRPVSKFVNDLDSDYRIQSAMAVIDRARCTQCDAIITAQNPFRDGTACGPVMLSAIMAMFEHENTDGQIAGLIHVLFGFKLTANAVAGARKAVSEDIQAGMLACIMRVIQLQSDIQMDETTYRRGDGHNGYVWVVYTPAAVFVLFTPTRSASVLSIHFAWLHNKPVTCDGYAGYPELTNTIQRDFIHILRMAEKLAATGGRPEDEARYDMLLKLYHDVKQIKTLAPFTMMELSRRTYGIAASYEDHKVRTHLLNAMPNLFTFLAHPGMSPHSNDVERTIRDGVISQRNARHKTMSDEGREVMSTLLTFTCTCKRQNVSSARALLEYLLDPDWNLFERAADTPYSLVNPDGTRYSVFDGIDPPPEKAAAMAA